MPHDQAYYEAEKKIEEVLQSGATELDLFGMKLTELPELLGQLTQLQSLDLTFNKLITLPKWIQQLKQLKILNLSYNQLKELPQSLGALTQLRFLNFNNNQLKELPEILERLTQLRSLNLSGNQLTQIPDWIANLINLEKLSLSGANLILETSKTGEIINRRASGQLTVLPSLLQDLKYLEFLDISANQFTVFPPLLAELKCLKYLNISGNQISVLPSFAKLKDLKALISIGNKLTDLPPTIAQIENLEELNLTHNPLNPELAEAYKQGIKSVKAYLRAKAAAQITLNEAKLILVGEGEVGKTCLMDALLGNEWQERPSTHGIEIKPIKLTNRKTKKEITLNGWDFGGQRVYRPTHQLFFSAPAVYLVVWKPREGPQQGFVKEWIKLVKHREPDAKILVVATHGGPQQRQPDIDRQELWDLFGTDTIADFLFVDSKPDADGNRKGIKELKNAIAHIATQLPEVGRSVPKSFQDVREALQARNVPYLPLDEVLAICHAHKMDDEIARLFITISHRLGHLTHYQYDPALRDIVILRPDWLATAISYIFDDEVTRAAHGLVRFSRLTKLLDDPSRPTDTRYPATLHPIFLRLMERFDLSYRVADSTPRGESDPQSLIAQLVPDNRPENFASAWIASPSSGDLQQTQICRIVDEKGTTTPAEGLFYQLIVRLHKYSLGRVAYADSVHWQRGLVLDDDYNGRALLEHKGNDVHITVRAPYPERFLAMLTEEVKYLVESFWEGLRCDVMVPCLNPTPCIGLFEVRKLIENKRRKRPEQPCPACNEWQNIDRLLLNAPAARPIPKVETLASQTVLNELGDSRQRLLQRNLKVFLCHASQDKPIAHELYLKFIIEGWIEPWLDIKKLLPGQDWQVEIMHAVKTADNVIIFLSNKSINKDGFIQKELRLAKDIALEKSEGSIFLIPLRIDNCEVPQGLEKYHWVNYFGGEQEQTYNKLIDSFKLRLEDIRRKEADAKKSGQQKHEDLPQTRIGRFDILESNQRELFSIVETSFNNFLQLYTDEAKEGPRLFSVRPVDSRWLEKPKQLLNQKFYLLLWCEHSQLPLFVLNKEGDMRGIYELDLPYEWVIKAAPYLKALTATLSLILPVASSTTKLMMSDEQYKSIEKQLAFGKDVFDSMLKGSDKLTDWNDKSDAPDLPHGAMQRAEGALLRELHSFLKEKDPGFGGLVRVMNKRQEFMWVHERFAGEY